MTEIEFYDGEFFIPLQTDTKQRDDVFQNIILSFAVDNNIIEKETINKDWTKIGKLYRLTNVKDGKEYTFQVGEISPFNGDLVLAIIHGMKFYSVINFNKRTESLSYSMVSFTNNTCVVYFK